MKTLYFLPFAFFISCGSESELNGENVFEPDTIDSIVEINIDTTELLSVPTVIDYTEYKELAFGFGDLDGDSVILMNKPDGLKGEDYDFGFTSKGKIDLKFLKSQKVSEDDNGRQNAYNFKNLKGEVYKVENNTAPLFETVMFASKEFVFKRKHLQKSTPYDSRELSKEQLKTIETDKGWSILKTGMMSSYQEGSLYFVEFDKQKDSVLVSIVWVSDEGNCYLDFPAEYNEMSTWRVDDGGVFDIDYYNIISVFKGDQGIEILTDWVGFEGSSVHYYVAHEGKFESVTNAYFYSAPL